LHPGTGDHYQINIEAVADPAPPLLADMGPDAIKQEIRRLLAQLEGVTEQEAVDQVHRRFTLYLCLPCFRDWIENPAGYGP
jgi:hypothetical protein